MIQPRVSKLHLFEIIPSIYRLFMRETAQFSRFGHFRLAQG
jgi:hypothetical protein